MAGAQARNDVRRRPWVGLDGKCVQKVKRQVVVRHLAGEDLAAGVCLLGEAGHDVGKYLFCRLQPEHAGNLRRRLLRASGLRDAVAQVGHGTRDGFPLRDQLGPLPGEQRRALPQQQRDEVDAHLVEQARPEQLPGDVRA